MPAVLLTNLGSPFEPTKEALKEYLAEFLWDKRVVDTWRPLWWLILKGIILPFRSQKSASLYEKIWTEEGSPLIKYSIQQKKAFESAWQKIYPEAPVALGMRYGEPSLLSALKELKLKGAREVILLPLYPQYSKATTLSTQEEVDRCLKKNSDLSDLKIKPILSYADWPLYIEALAQSVRDYQAHHGACDQFLISYHGLPARSIREKDPYFFECLKTTRALVKVLGLKQGDYKMVFQSRFGREKWIKPYATDRLKKIAQTPHQRVQVLCPGFAADCLETLEEINQTYREFFEKEGGGEFGYIPALNSRPSHIKALVALAQSAV